MHRFERWRSLIATAAREEDVVKLVREYLNVLMPSETAKLPMACQDILSGPLPDIPGAAFDLVREELQFAGDAEAGAMLHEIAHTFTAASARLAQLEARRHGLGADTPT